MRRLLRPAWLFAVLVAGPTLAQGAVSGDRILIYVDDVVPAQASLATDAAALTIALCATISKDPRFEVLCAPDVQQLLSFAATTAMMGSTSGGPSAVLQERLVRSKHIVSASFAHDGGFTLTIKAGPKAADAPAIALYSDKPVITLKETGTGPGKILEKLPALASRILAALAPASTPPPPPAPLTSAPPRAPTRAPTGGW